MDILEAVIVSVDYGDYLADTLPALLPHVSDLIVYTSPSDWETQAVCAQYGVRCVVSDVHQAGGARIDKARAIHHALRFLGRKGLLLQVDADVWVPPNMGQCLRAAELRRECIYGVDRVDCPGIDAWEAWTRDRRPDFGRGVFVQRPGNWPLGARVVYPDGVGWCPLGFFQLWHGSVCNDYLSSPGAECEHSDLLHSSRWSRSKRCLVPDFYVVHLTTGSKPFGQDWGGRKSPRWGRNPWSLARGAVRTGKRAPDSAPAL